MIVYQQLSIILVLITVLSDSSCNKVEVIEGSSSGSKSYHSSNKKVRKSTDDETDIGTAGSAGSYGITGMLAPPMIGMVNPSLMSGGMMPMYPGLIGHNMGIYNTMGGGVGYASNKDLEEANKAVKGDQYEKASGSQGASKASEAKGFEEKSAAEKDNSGQAGFYNKESGEKSQTNDAKEYEGAKHYTKEGKFEDIQKTHKGYRRGHNKKGNKASHTKDASEKTETFYDEAHDEVDNVNLFGNTASQGKKEGASYAGTDSSGKVNNEKIGKSGGFESASVLDTSKGETGKFGASGFNTNNQMFGMNSGLGLNMAKGHVETGGMFKNYGSSFPSFK